MVMLQIKENVRSSQKKKKYICNGMCHAHLQVGVFGSISLALSLVRGQHLPRYTESGAFPSIFYCLSSWLFLSLSKIIYNFSNILNFFFIIWVCVTKLAFLITVLDTLSLLQKLHHSNTKQVSMG